MVAKMSQNASASGASTGVLKNVSGHWPPVSLVPAGSERLRL